MADFPENLRTARKKAGLTQEELGFMLDVTKASISAWEIGRESPSFKQLKPLREALLLTLDELIYGDVPAVEESQDAGYKAGVTSLRSDEEKQLLVRFRALKPTQRKALLALLSSGFPN